ncbi:MAG: hypothetical protein L0287_29175 [Anaerolineae bacterium]|nr:hypothetical protein [Anaerolineae bacterium]
MAITHSVCAYWLKDFENPADIIVAQKLKIDGDIKQQKHHVLEVSYDSLPQQEQKLLSTIACFRSPVLFNTLKALSKPTRGKGLLGFFKKIKGIYDGSLDNDLRDLVERGLLHFYDKDKKFDLHPIVRRYAYERLPAPDRTASHTRLIIYFEVLPTPQKIEKLEDLVPVIELYHHMVSAGKLDEARRLYNNRLAEPIYFQFGTYQTQIELLSALFLDGEDKPPRLKDESAQAWTLNSLANSYSLSGQPRRAVQIIKMVIGIDEKNNDKSSDPAITLENVAENQVKIGALREAEHNLHRSIDLCREILDKFWEAVGHQELGRILSYRGVWQEAEEHLLLAQKVFDNVGPRTNYGSVNMSCFEKYAYVKR